MKTIKNYIGLATTFHDPAIAIVNEHGEIRFAEAGERYLQSKLAIGMNGSPAERLTDLIREYCTPGADLVVCHTWSAGNLEWLYQCGRTLESAEAELEKHQRITPFYHRRDNAQLRFMLDMQISTLHRAETKLRYALSRLKGSFENLKLSSRHYDHHLTHAAAACYSSAFDEAVCLVIDGEGEYFRGNDLFHYQQGKIERVKLGNAENREREQPRPPADGMLAFSIGRFFAMVTQSCGFGVLTGEEWKVMGLAPYGTVQADLYRQLKRYLVIDGVEIRPISQMDLLSIFDLFSSIEKRPEQSLWDIVDIAATGQKVFSDCVIELAGNVFDSGISNNLVLGGGCALNSTVNGLLLENTGFENLHVYSAPADDGNALGAALLAYYEDNPDRAGSRGAIISPYLGSAIPKKAVDRVKKLGGMKCSTTKGNVAREAARLIAEGNIIGWVQGRAEFGPRALGNRSILADPRDERIKDKINNRVKFREEFRPFAPSILHEYGNQYFENYQESPYMERTLKFKDAARNLVPGVVHVNNTGRVQTVKKEWNELFYHLLQAFYDITGIPVLLNTSFNVMGKPIIHSIEDAIAVFYTTGLDVLVVGDEIFQK